MTDNPGRRRGDDEEARSAEEAPAGLPPQLPAAFSPNGRTPTATLIEQLPQMLFQAFAQALSQVQARTAPGWCGPCAARRMTWMARHGAEIAEAEALVAAAQAVQAALPPEDRAPLVALEYLPAHLRPGADAEGGDPMPDLRQGEVLLGGTWHCMQDVPVPETPGAPRKQFLIAQGALSSAMLAEARSTPVPPA